MSVRGRGTHPLASEVSRTPTGPQRDRADNQWRSRPSETPNDCFRTPGESLDGNWNVDGETLSITYSKNYKITARVPATAYTLSVAFNPNTIKENIKPKALRYDVMKQVDDATRSFFTQSKPFEWQGPLSRELNTLREGRNREFPKPKALVWHIDIPYHLLYKDFQALVRLIVDYVSGVPSRLYRPIRFGYIPTNPYSYAAVVDMCSPKPFPRRTMGGMEYTWQMDGHANYPSLIMLPSPPPDIVPPTVPPAPAPAPAPAPDQ